MSQTPGSAMLIVILALAGLGMLVASRSGARSGNRLARHSQEVGGLAEDDRRVAYLAWLQRWDGGWR